MPLVRGATVVIWRDRERVIGRKIVGRSIAVNGVSIPKVFLFCFGEVLYLVTSLCRNSGVMGY